MHLPHKLPLIADMPENEETAQNVAPDHDTSAAPIVIGVCVFWVYIAILFCMSL